MFPRLIQPVLLVAGSLVTQFLLLVCAAPVVSLAKARAKMVRFGAGGADGTPTVDTTALMPGQWRSSFSPVKLGKGDPASPNPVEGMSQRRRRKYRREQLISLLRLACRRVIQQLREERRKLGRGAWNGTPF